MPHPLGGALSDDARLTSVWRLSRTSGRPHMCGRPASWDGVYWLIGPGSAGLAQGCRCALPLQEAGAYRGGLPHSLYWGSSRRYPNISLWDLCSRSVKAKNK